MKLFLVTEHRTARPYGGHSAPMDQSYQSGIGTAWPATLELRAFNKNLKKWHFVTWESDMAFTFPSSSSMKVLLELSHIRSPTRGVPFA